MYTTHEVHEEILRGTMIFMSDDLTVRRIAYKMGVSVSGTIGVLVKCVDKDIISFLEENIILVEMI